MEDYKDDNDYNDWDKTAIEKAITPPVVIKVDHKKPNPSKTHTMVYLKKNTVEKLKQLKGRPGETYDILINRLMFDVKDYMDREKKEQERNEHEKE